MLLLIILILLLTVILVPYILIVESINHEVDQQNVEDDNKNTKRPKAEFPYYEAILPVIIAFAFLVSSWSCVCIKYGFYWQKRSEWLDQNREKWNK